MKRTRVIWGIVGLLIGGGASFVGTTMIGAQQSSRLEQSIVSEECGATTYDTAIGQTNAPFCEVFAPSISRYDASEGALVFYGAFDRVHTQINLALGMPYLQVEVNGVIYTLGSSPELHSDGNTWWLDLSGLRASFDNGMPYTIRVSSVMSDGRILSSEGVFVVGEKGIPQAPDTGSGRNIFVIMIVLMVLSVFGMIASIGYVYWQRKKERGRERA